jgi:hypothetical protein
VLFGDATFGDSGLPADPAAPNKPAVGVRNTDLIQVNVVVSGWQGVRQQGSGRGKARALLQHRL